ncbi:MAG: acetyl-CoA carboxylase biotin carboxyl carrier protein subunit [Ignavibacteria bacterium]|nr:acetyl-CoA carboxylase biotin carboxyl carrier protein subunit [Ignavibacteriota bacterium]
MNKYTTKIDGSETINSIEITGDTTALFNGEEVSYDHKFLSKNVILLRINDKNFIMTISYNDEDMTAEMNLDSKIYTLTCKSELDLIKEKLTIGKGGGKLKKDIKSPMPGIIKAMNVAAGQEVKKGEILLVLEAMKMENEIKATSDCIVKKVNVEAMSSVEKNELLIELE